MGGLENHGLQTKSWPSCWYAWDHFLLEDDVGGGFVEIFKAVLKIIIQNADVEVSIHSPINLACIAHTIPQHTTPHHHGTTPKLECTLHQPITQTLPSLFPDPLPSI